MPGLRPPFRLCARLKNTKILLNFYPTLHLERSTVPRKPQVEVHATMSTASLLQHMPLGSVLRERPIPGDWLPEPDHAPIIDTLKKQYTETQLIRTKFTRMVIKWVCPRCGDEVVADFSTKEFRFIHTPGSKHGEVAFVISPVFLHLFDYQNKPCNTGVRSNSYPVSVTLHKSN